MIPSLWVIVVLGVLIAYVNGANDVSKGIATLAGSGVTNYRRAILWGSLWTGIGGLAPFNLPQPLLPNFCKGGFAPGTNPPLPFPLALLLGRAPRGSPAAPP